MDAAMTTLFKDLRTATTIGIILLGMMVLLFAINRFYEKSIRSRTALNKRDLIGLRFLKQLVVALVYVSGLAFALFQIPELRIIGHSLLAGAGIVSLVAGLASQQALGNMMSGIVLVIFRPFRIDDRITVNGFTGTVEDMNLRFDQNGIEIPFPQRSVTINQR